MAKAKIKWHVETRKVSQLKEWKKNPRRLTKTGLESLRKSIDKFGVAEPLVINTDNVICGGHGRKKVLVEMGVADVECYVPDRELTVDEFTELNIRLNKNIAGEWDFDILAKEFQVSDLTEWGFSENEFNNDVKVTKIIATKPCPMQHILISYHVKEHEKISDVLELLKDISGIEVVRSGN